MYIDETRDEKPRPFYVGKGTKTRVSKRDRNEHWKRIASKHGWNRRIVDGFATEAEAFELEIALIRLHGTFEFDLDFGLWGANHTRGGEGASGMTFHHTIEARLKISQAQKGRSKPTMRNRPLSMEHRTKIGLGHRGKKQHASQIAKRSGEKNVQAKLTWEQVYAIRKSVLAQRTLAAQYGVSHTLIGYIKRGLLWQEPTEKVNE